MVPAEVKWKSLFQKCKGEITGQSNFEEPGLSVWDNIERSIEKKRSSDIRKRYSQKVVKEEESEFLAERKEVDCCDFNEIQNFLKKVCLKLPYLVAAGHSKLQFIQITDHRQNLAR